MRLLLDTHILLWVLIEPERLSAESRALFENPDNEILFSVASIWEIAIKSSLGKADFLVEPIEIVKTARVSGFTELPIGSAAALHIAKLPMHHRDPFDRLLVAQAITEPAILFTSDAQLRIYSELVRCI
jgi:PIN domain nuclease of toxin-antitoxin system